MAASGGCVGTAGILAVPGLPSRPRTGKTMPELLQRAIALVMGIAATPLLAILGLAVRLDSRGPILFRATRVGDGGRAFTCLKLRTMTWRPAAVGSGISVRDDPRATRVGRLLRASRADELPQLWNVVRGEMLLVGPRPEDPRFVDLEDPLHARVFRTKPGITGLAQLAYADEAERLDRDDPERHYREVILPEKLALDAAYLARRSATLDLWILLQTIRTALGRGPSRKTIEARLGTSLGDR